MAQMRAVLVKDGAGGSDSLFIGETEKPTPAAGEVLVKIKAFGLNRMDISQREGRYSLQPGTSTILGVEFSGHISEVGSNVTQWKTNDEVFGLATGGAYAEYIKISQKDIWLKPANLSWAEAASIPECWITAFQGLRVIGKVKANESVLVHAGASGVGLAAIQLARIFGAKTVIATASTQDKLDFLLNPSGGAMGATHAVNYKTQDFSEEVKRITGGHGVDVLIDFVGQTHWQKNINSLAVDGRMTMLALLSGAKVPEFDLSVLLYKRLHIEGSTLRFRPADYKLDLYTRFREEVLPSLVDSKLRTYIHKVYPWTEISDAHKEMEANKNIGKIVAEIN